MLLGRLSAAVTKSWDIAMKTSTDNMHCAYIIMVLGQSSRQSVIHMHIYKSKQVDISSETGKYRVRMGCVFMQLSNTNRIVVFKAECAKYGCTGAN